MQARRELQYLHINANGTTSLNVGQLPNFLGSCVIGTPGTAGTVSLYDGPAVPANLVSLITLAANMPNNLPFDCYLVNNAGLVVVAAGFTGGPDVTISYGTKV